LILKIILLNEDIDFLKNENNYYKYITIINQNNKEYLSIDEIIKKQPTNIRLDISCFSKDDILKK